MNVLTYTAHDVTDTVWWFDTRCGYETLKMGQRRMQSDVYALGMVYWQMWAMRDPNTLPSVAAKPFRNVTRQQVSEP